MLDPSYSMSGDEVEHITIIAAGLEAPGKARIQQFTAIFVQPLPASPSESGSAACLRVWNSGLQLFKTIEGS